MAAFEADAGPALATLRCPVLALHGEDDVMTPARHGRALLRHAADGRLATVPEAGHAAPIERPTAVAAALRAFWSAAANRAAEAAAPQPRAVPGSAPTPGEETR
jgi:3-oxoadipate enol-lactonase/3-oxoadipate enol-lactonase/4-carboxymuconolactone decarboxylase